MQIKPIFGSNSNYAQMSPHIVDNLFTSEEIDWIEDIKNYYSNSDGMLLDKKDDRVRKSTIKWLPHNTETEWLYDKLASSILDVNFKKWGFSLSSIIDDIQYTEYYENGGHYGWHVDVGNYNLSNHRKISVTVQLSDPSEYEGGVLQFNTGGDNYIDAPKEKGLGVLFPSYILHRVTPVTKGTRKSLVMWVGGDTFR